MFFADSPLPLCHEIAATKKLLEYFCAFIYNWPSDACTTREMNDPSTIAAGEHYDIRLARRAGENQFIEVKGLALTVLVVLTGLMMEKLRQSTGRAYRYIVTLFKSKTEFPRLRIIQPTVHLMPEMLCRQMQYLVEEQHWPGKGDEVEVAP